MGKKGGHFGPKNSEREPEQPACGVFAVRLRRHAAAGCLFPAEQLVATALLGEQMEFCSHRFLVLWPSKCQGDRDCGSWQGHGRSLQFYWAFHSIGALRGIDISS